MTNSADIVVLGGGAIGLATAIELAQGGCQVTILNHQPQCAALYAAAGMLAPQAEQIEHPEFFEFCVKSRDLYPTWIQSIEQLSGVASGYWPCGILAPQFQSRENRTSKLSESTPSLVLPQEWLDQGEIHQLEPLLHESVVGGWFYPKDAQVDNRQLGNALNLAAQSLGVTLHHNITISAVQTDGNRITSVITNQGNWQASQYLLATGAWAGQLINLPVVPRKGQMLSIRPMAGQASLEMQQVLFGEHIYIVPRQSGDLILGATSESVGFTSGNTVAGIQQLLNAATQLVPALAAYQVQEQWWGYRPTTPDELPILGSSPWKNLAIATGHHRNGILLTPITAKLMSQYLIDGILAESLTPFQWTRFSECDYQEH